MEPSRSAGLDAMRGIAIAAVVARHASWRMLDAAPADCAARPALAVAHLVAGLGVPLFVALSAHALAWKHGQGVGGLAGHARLLASRAKRLLPGYLTFSLVSLAARDLALLHDPAGVAHALVEGTADVQFYYVPMLMELTLLWPLLRPLLVRRSRTGALATMATAAVVSELSWRWVLLPTHTALAFFAVCVALGTGLRLLVGDPAAAAGPEGGSTALPMDAGWTRRSAKLAGAASLLAVAALVLESRRLVAALPAAPPGLLLGALTSVFAWGPMAWSCFVTVALTAAAGPLAASGAGRALAALGRASYGIFLVHLLVASSVVAHLVPTAPHEAMGAGQALRMLALGWALTLAASWGLALGLARIPALAWLVGEQGRGPLARGLPASSVAHDAHR